MFKIFRHIGKIKFELIAINGVFEVVETNNYSFSYKGNIIETNVIIEDLLIDPNKIKRTNNGIDGEIHRYFQDFFGFGALNINKEEFIFNIKVEKLKLSEIESIFEYLWNKEDNLLNIFFSKSTKDINFSNNGIELTKTSKFISYVEYFIEKFELLLPYFSNRPHYISRTKNEIQDFSNAKVTYDSVSWILSNLDEIDIDYEYRNHPNNFKILDKYGILNKIETNVNVKSFNNYENNIIIGSFENIIIKLKKLKNEVTSNVDITENNDELADFKELKKIPFRRLFNKSSNLERRTSKLIKKYKNIFGEITPIKSKPKVTPVFKNIIHYNKSFTLIKNLYNYKFNLNGEFRLLNIKKLSQLYEVYNLYQLDEAITSQLRLEHFNVEKTSDREDDILNIISYTSKYFEVNLFYEIKYKNVIEKTYLKRIDNKASYYNPDYVIEIINNIGERFYYILDSKYSKKEIIEQHYLSKCILKYINKTAIHNEKYRKIDALVLLYPGNESNKIIDDEFHKPIISILCSKPNYNNDLKIFIEKIIKEKLPTTLYKQNSEISA